VNDGERPTSDAGSQAAPATGRGSLMGPRLIAVGLLALGLVILVDALRVGRGTGFRPIGPGFMPTIVAVGLVLLAISLIVRTTLRPDADLAEHAAEQAASTSWPTVGLVMAALVGYALLLGPLGYILATAALVPVAARILGSRAIIRDAIVGVGMSVAIWLAFTEFLGVRLPAGILEPFV
jgi:putative tricarboxylic transport membrane protein